MKVITGSALVGATFLTLAHAAPRPDVDTRFPYTGPAVPIADWVDPTINGNGKGFPRLVEPPAVAPKSSKPSNNVNVISVSYLPKGVNIHYQTPFGLGHGVAPTIHYGTRPGDLNRVAKGTTQTYDRTPPCSLVVVTQCSQFFHNVQISNLRPDTTYYYLIPSANGTTTSDVLTFTTARAAGDQEAFSVAVLNDMGYTNAHGTHQQLTNLANDKAVAFAWHGGDISYADDWYSGILPCASDWPVCYNGTLTQLPGGPPIPAEYDAPLPAGEIPDQGGPQGGDMNVLYESNWDLWQQWQNSVTLKIPYMTLPGNHEAACAEFDGPGNILTAYLNDNEPNTTVAKSGLTYYSCPPSQRNFTAFQNRFRMPGSESHGVGNFWYSFDYGMAHFISLDTETDFAFSPEFPFGRDLTGNETLPTEDQTFITDSGPFGTIDDNNFDDNSAYEQVQWLAKDLAAVDRKKTPWIIAMGHRPMYSSQTASYQKNIRAAFEAIMLQHGVDAYFSGHIHWYERLFPLGANGTINTAAIVNNDTYTTSPGKSIMHIVNGMAGNIESHSELDGDPVLNITRLLDTKHYGLSQMTFHNASAMTWSFIKGDGTGIGDSVTLIKEGSSAPAYGHWQA